jgi:hypothetical protein
MDEGGSGESMLLFYTKVLKFLCLNRFARAGGLAQGVRVPV